MNPQDEDNLSGAIKAAHEPDARDAPRFDETWRAAEERSKSTNTAVWAAGITGAGLLAAAGIAVVGFIGMILLYAMMHDPPSSLTVAEVETTATQTSPGNPEDDALDEDTLADYDILDWEPETDSLLARDDRTALEPPTFGVPSWGDDWNDFESDELQEL